MVTVRNRWWPRSHPGRPALGPTREWPLPRVYVPAVDRVPEVFFADDPLGLAVYRHVRSVLADAGPVDVRATKTQVAFRRRRGFAYLWLPERTLGAQSAGIVVLSFALARHDPSARFKEVVRVSPRYWMHHLELRYPAEVDAEIEGWLVEAVDRAG